MQCDHCGFGRAARSNAVAALQRLNTLKPASQ